jgi:hypothetical protein
LTGIFGLDSQDIAPFQGPVGGKFIADKQGIDQFGAFIQPLVTQELTHFLGGRKRADLINIDPTDKDFVGTQVGGGNLVLDEVVQYGLINGIVDGKSGIDFKGNDRCRPIYPTRKSQHTSQQ